MKTFLKALCFLIDVVLFFGCFFVLNKIGIDKNGIERGLYAGQR